MKLKVEATTLGKIITVSENTWVTSFLIPDKVCDRLSKWLTARQVEQEIEYEDPRVS